MFQKRFPQENKFDRPLNVWTYWERVYITGVELVAWIENTKQMKKKDNRKLLGKQKFVHIRKINHNVLHGSAQG